MIAACPKCAAKYRIDVAKLRPEGARLRCSRCETVFRVQPDAEEVSAASAAMRAPAAPHVSRSPQGREAAAQRGEAERSVGPREGWKASEDHRARSAAPAPQRVAPMPARSAPAAPASAGDPAKRVLIAHPEVEAGKAVADALASWGLSPLLVHDGVEAMLQIQRTLPKVVVLDAALPKMFGFQICEIMKRNQQLRVIPVVLIGAIHDQDRYRRPPPEELYGADAYVERHQLPDALADLLVRFGLGGGSAAVSRPEPAPVPVEAPAPVLRPAAPAPAPRAPVPAPARVARPAAPAPIPTPAPAARPAAPAPTAADPELEKANRLARIIVSDVILYNTEKFEAAVRAGNVVTALAAELEEGYSLFASRVDPRVGDPREYLQRELVRVARSRGMK
jgi:predicted Zn finger-like uncharacterized protein